MRRSASPHADEARPLKAPRTSAASAWTPRRTQKKAGSPVQALDDLVDQFGLEESRRTERKTSDICPEDAVPAGATEIFVIDGGYAMYTMTVHETELLRILPVEHGGVTRRFVVSSPDHGTRRLVLQTASCVAADCSCLVIEVADDGTGHVYFVRALEECATTFAGIMRLGLDIMCAVGVRSVWLDDDAYFTCEPGVRYRALIFRALTGKHEDALSIYQQFGFLPGGQGNDADVRDSLGRLRNLLASDLLLSITQVLDALREGTMIDTDKARKAFNFIRPTEVLQVLRSFVGPSTDPLTVGDVLARTLREKQCRDTQLVMQAVTDSVWLQLGDVPYGHAAGVMREANRAADLLRRRFAVMTRECGADAV